MLKHVASFWYHLKVDLIPALPLWLLFWGCHHCMWLNSWTTCTLKITDEHNQSQRWRGKLAIYIHLKCAVLGTTRQSMQVSQCLQGFLDACLKKATECNFQLLLDFNHKLKDTETWSWKSRHKLKICSSVTGEKEKDNHYCVVITYSSSRTS